MYIDQLYLFPSFSSLLTLILREKPNAYFAWETLINLLI